MATTSSTKKLASLNGEVPSAGAKLNGSVASEGTEGKDDKAPAFVARLVAERARRATRIARMKKRLREFSKDKPRQDQSDEKLDDEEAERGVLSGTIDAFRETCWDLELRRHLDIYESEKGKVHSMGVMDQMFQDSVNEEEEGYETKRKDSVMKLLQENADKMRRVQELRYQLVRDDERATWQRRHEMSLRGRGGAPDQDHVRIDGEIGGARTNKRSRKGTSNSTAWKVQSMNIMQLEPEEVAKDISMITGEKRLREKESENNGQERKNKRRK